MFLKCWFPVKPATWDNTHPGVLAIYFPKKICLRKKSNQLTLPPCALYMYFLILYKICLCFCKLYFSDSKNAFLRSFKLHFVVFAPLRIWGNWSGSWQAPQLPLKSLSPSIKPATGRFCDPARPTQVYYQPNQPPNLGVIDTRAPSYRPLTPN